MTKLLLLLAASSLTLASCGKPANSNNAADRNGGASNDVDNSNLGTTVGANGDITGTNGGMNGGMDGTNTGMDGANGANMAVPVASAQDYVTRAAASDQFEIQSSDMVLKQTRNAAVRAFAQQMVSDHSASTTKLMALAKTAALTAPGTGLQARNQTNMAALRNAGGEMDQVYINQQRAAHAEAIALHQSAASNTNMPAPLTAFANNVLPTVQAHSRMLADMKATPPRS